VARGSDARKRLLEAAIEHIAAHGISDLSLRELAAAIGTSHRMLIHHFGSKQGLWVQVIRTVEERQREVLAEIVPDPAQAPAEALRDWWRHISDPALWPNERLFFEVYAQALQGATHAVPLLDGIVDAWVEPLTRIAVAQGRSDEQARAEARLGVAVTRGLLLDLLATEDRRGVDQAMRLFIDLVLDVSDP